MKRLKAFRLWALYFSLPSFVFQAEFLEELYLEFFKLDQINNNFIINVKLHMLKRLSLKHVFIYDETFEKIMSSCPSIQHLALRSCRGLSAVKVNKARNLKHFDCESIKNGIENNNYYFPRLKSLKLQEMHLPGESLNNLSSNNNCPCLEELELRCCSGFTEFELSNRSIKRLIIDLADYDPLTKVAIDAANMQYFEFRSGHLPSIVSFETTSSEWRSHILLSHYSDDFLSSTWSLKLHEFLKALSQSQVSLVILPYVRELTNQDTYNDGGSCEPVVVEHLCLREYCSYSEIPTLLNCLFRIFRPRYVGLSSYSYSQSMCVSQLVESIWKTPVNKGETTKCNFWEQDLEGSSIQVLDKNAKEWRAVQGCEFSNNKHEIRLRLKWRHLC